jgi:hypothetical protein
MNGAKNGLTVLGKLAKERANSPRGLGIETTEKMFSIITKERQISMALT